MHSFSICSEISSAYPTSGGLYWWAARLSSKRYAPATSWMTGWFNLIGQFAVTAGINYGIALMIAATVTIGTNGAWVPTVGATVGIHIAMCVTQGIANSLGSKVMTTLNCKLSYISLLSLYSYWFSSFQYLVASHCSCCYYDHTYRKGSIASNS